VHDGALLLEAACRPLALVNGHPTRYAEPLVATFLLTGGRVAEVLGLEVDDVSFDRKTVTFRPNAWRRLKTKRSHRTVPLWPQLEEILRTYLSERTAQEVLYNRPTHRLLFPAEDGGMRRDIRGLLDRLGERAGWKPGEIRAKMFRHTYCAARLQTLGAARRWGRTLWRASWATTRQRCREGVQPPRDAAAPERSGGVPGTPWSEGQVSGPKWFE
jgi:integrase